MFTGWWNDPVGRETLKKGRLRSLRRQDEIGSRECINNWTLIEGKAISQFKKRIKEGMGNWVWIQERGLDGTEAMFQFSK